MSQSPLNGSASDVAIVHDVTAHEAIAIIDDAQRDKPVVLISRTKSEHPPVSMHRLCALAGPDVIILMLTDHKEALVLTHDRRWAVHSGALLVIGHRAKPGATRIILTGFAATGTLEEQLPDAINMARSAMMTSHNTEASDTRETFSAVKLEQLNISLQQKLNTAHATIRAMNKRAGGPLLVDPVFNDPEKQLRFDIQLAWLRATPPDERETWPLRNYTIGSDFIGSWDSITTLDRARVITVSTEIITRRAYEMHARRVHPHTDGPRGNPIIRNHDGAAAFRASLKDKSPSAPRLLFWELTDGSVELSRAALHDDMSMS